ncbi:hypothetical protein F5146DRAFT_1018044 [Armillaria mellea]|nr:hypothetical protein F5146DRAFT_1018044 [Armillaria mellea]
MPSWEFAECPFVSTTMTDPVLTYIVNHVFMPPALPQADDHDITHDAALCHAVLDCARGYRSHLLNDVHKLRNWDVIIKMLQSFEQTLNDSLNSTKIYNQLSSMEIGDSLVFYINGQNACVVFRKQATEVIYEAFEVMFPNEKVMGAIGKLVSSFPGPAIAFPSEIFEVPAFRQELASFLMEMHRDFLKEAQPTSRKAGSDVIEEREPAHPRFITQLLTGILYGQGGRAATIERFSKRINDDVRWLNAKLPWRRSPIWLVIRVALQSSLFEGVDHLDYKTFITYFLASILDKARAGGRRSDLIDIMKKKMCRRLAKLGSFAPLFLQKQVHAVGERVNDLIEERGRHIEIQQQRSSEWNPSKLDIDADTTITLPNSSSYIKSILQRASSPQPVSPFSPSHIPRLKDNPDFSSFTKDRLSLAFNKDKFIALADFEAQSSGILSVCLFEYKTAAEAVYLSNAEDESIMLLTIMDLWVALDRVAVAQYPLLQDYSPEVPADLLIPLLLRRSKPLNRLVLITQYIRKRHSSAVWNNLSLFAKVASYNSFAIRYFNSSTEHQQLKQRIEDDASLERGKKVKELQEANDHYHTLKGEAVQLSHEYVTRWQRWQQCYEEVHDYNCQKCKLEKEYTSMTIHVHEHPLPDDTTMAKMVVFEIKCPTAIQHWRVATYTILHDLCTPSSAHEESPAESPMELASYLPLQKYIAEKLGRVNLASTTKSFLQSHYKDPKIPSTEAQVCLCSGLKYQLYDSRDKTWIENPFVYCDIYDRCTLKLTTDGVYDNLQYAIRNTTHTSNTIIANQSDCQTGLTLHEYAAFTGLRSGERLQWLNIARELRARTLTFNQEAVHTLLTQSACQVGVVAENDTLEWHIDLYDHSFRQVLMEELWELLMSVGDNWLESVTLKSIILLMNQLLMMTTSTEANHSIVNNSVSAYDIMRKARMVIFSWVQKLVKKLQETVKEDDIQDLQHRIFELAATTQATYDVKPEHVQALLQSDEDVKVLVESAIIMHDNTPIRQQFISPERQRLLRQSERLSHFIEPYLQNKMSDIAHQQAYHATYWTVTLTAVDAGQQSQLVHLNLLTGLLLINGKPLGRLPQNITSHATYSRIFGTKILDVIPSDIPDIEYACRLPILGWQVYLGLQSNTLIIRAKKKDITLELIPYTVFNYDLPQLFTEEYTHWINLAASSTEIEFWPLASLWKSCSQNWRMIFDAPKRTMSLNDQKMIDIHSQTFKMVSACLQNFEQCHYIHITYATSGSTALSVDLPRFQLSFFLNKDTELECHNLPNMLIDKNQSAGSLLGLKSRLVLCSKHSFKLPRSRHILVPFGKVHIEQQQDHVQVFYDYTIDSDIGCFVSGSDLTSNLHPLPDPLTGQTGTEEAIQLLQSATCYSFQDISKIDMELLDKIAAFTPSSTWYPQYKQSMQSIQYHYTYGSSQGQHHAFYKLVEAIIDYARLTKVFSISSDHSLSLSQVYSQHLLDRSSFRLSYLYPADYSLFDHQQKNYDAIYHSHDQEQDDTKIAINASQMIKTECFSKISDSFFIEKISNWKNIGPGDKNFSLSYKRLWLSSEYLQKNWLFFLLSTTIRRWQALFSISAMSYNDTEIRAIIPSLLALTVYHWQHISGKLNFSWCSIHYLRSYDLSIGVSPKESQLNDSHSPVAAMEQHNWETHSSFLHRKEVEYNRLDKEQAPAVLHQLFASWSQETEPTSIYISTQSSSMFKIDIFVLVQHSQILSVASYNFTPCSTKPIPHLITMTMKQLLVSRYRAADNSDTITAFQPNKYSLLNSQLASLTSEFSNSSSILERLYGKELEESRQHLISMPSSFNNSFTSISKYQCTCQEILTQTLIHITTLLKASDTCELALHLGGLWPCINTRSLFHQFTQNIGAGWKSTIKKFVLLFMQHQRVQRLLLSVINQNSIEFYKDMSNNEVTAIHPEWLLLQVDNNFISRSIQTSVAHEIISPSVEGNCVLQLNMGEGKSSVIVPMTAIIAADGQSIARVVVLKSLAKQMFQLLVQRISGLVNRRVFYMPFSRHLIIGSKEIKDIWNLYHQCMKAGGVLVIQPEHILSFKLMCVSRLLDNNKKDMIGQDAETSQLLELQKWLDSHVRDILDESDEILHVRYQLIYTMGHPDRWMITQQIFTLVAEIISSIKLKAPQSVEVHYSEKNDNSFPFISIYSTDDKAGIEIVDSICAQIFAGRLENYPIFKRLSDNLCKEIQQFISKFTVEPDVVKSVRELYFGTDTWNVLLLLCGLFAHGILIYVLKARRYRVDYGLDLNRTLLAVPYRAKDVPSLAAEFGHPDVAIALTCLSYYYAGLTNEQVDMCFDLLFKEDDPNVEYSSWIKNNKQIPQQLQHINGVNIKDAEQRSCCLRPFFYHNCAVVNFFLSHVVFPKYAKEFPQKISTSGWDIAATRSKYTTGFSGTNDNHHLLPLSIQQYDPVEQQSTNAKVLDCLLRPENNHYQCTGSSLATTEFLKLLVDQVPEIRVLLDVGAQMLDLHNRKLAESWLDLQPASVLSAAIYFDDTDELMVLDRRGITEPLLLSPFKYQIDKCVIYLDEAHTRGTDLKLPIHFRAAVTLGANVTKDRLVQGAMRMRQLGQGQSVIFFAPQEIDLKIRKAAGKLKSTEKVEAVDILRWSMLETCEEITHHIPQWAQQGYDYQQRKEAWEACISSNGLPTVLDHWLQPEACSLEELYGLSDGPTLGSAIWKISELRERCKMLGVSFISGTNMDEEQEREVNHEIEREQQVERPPKVSSATHFLHNDVRLFIQTGTIKAPSTAFQQLFCIFDGISSAFLQGENVWSPNLFCTQDFAVTIKTSSHYQNTSDYLRSINWIVSAQHNESTTLVVLSPFEVNELLPEIRDSSNVHLHIYSSKVSLSTKAFDDLQFYCIPKPGIQINNALIITQLNIFAGQLYLRDYKEYQWLCSFLGLDQGQHSTDEKILIQSDGFIKPEHCNKGDISPFKTSPVPFLKALLGSRRKGHPYLTTHLGKMLHGYVLTPESFD